MSTATPMPEQGRAGLSLPSPINMDWTFPDRDAPLPVYLLVQAPSSPTSSSLAGVGPAQTWRDLHWSLSWQPAEGAWRHVQVDMYDVKTDPAPQPRYVFWGARTTTADAAAEGSAARLELGTLARDERRRVEQMAWEVPVMYPNGEWNCQNWVRGLFERMVEAGLVKQERVDEVVKVAETVHGDLPVP
ncbi:hypothetical protein BD310DRAFT_951480 [Dichomitus squalens]|uniref:Uncharacterized protein n=1 Tax=Dichomitus squalens TaxID=114155 RepID=A0A4Q9PJT1_9APHY|nr:hypothetical protein BD310DRAFT_951480 [Dichomitus squalens]